MELLFEHPLWNARQTKQLDVESERGMNSIMKTVILGMEKDIATQ